MRARHRHFNPKSAGAEVVWDARFVAGLSDGTECGSWTDRSGGTAYNATQAAAGAKPVFKTNIQGGQPALRFDGGDWLEHGINRPSAMSVIHILKVTGGGTVQQSASFANPNTNLICSFNPRANSNAFAGSFSNTWRNAGFNANSFSVYSFTDNAAGSWAFFKDGLAGNTYTSQAIYTDSVNRKIVGGLPTGSPQTQRFVGDYCIGIMLPFVVAAPLQKRIERSVAIAFKISCN